MCFRIKKADKTAKIAEKDIPCLKCLRRRRNSLYSPAFTSASTMWHAGKVNKVSNFPTLQTEDRDIEGNALHSLKTWGGAGGWFCDDIKAYPAVIPAGSIYWENSREYVSNQLLVISDVPLTKGEALGHLKKK